MSILMIILLTLTGIIILLLILAIFMRKNYFFERSVIIEAPAQNVFDYVKCLKNQDYFNKWVMVEPDMKKEFKGTDGTVGFIYAWKGKKSGEGEQEIKSITEGKGIATEIRFVKPMLAIAYVTMSTEAVSPGTTRVSWSNASTMKYPMNVMISLIEKMLAKDMDTSLGILKGILEKR